MVVLVVAMSKDWFRTVNFITPLVAGLHEVLTLARFGSLVALRATGLQPPTILGLYGIGSILSNLSFLKICSGI